ncbi:type II toxin-antitoxin system death-on-curing family toxin [Candidatus Saccharibacteria bacterium]|nr:type II toxin-antitoxin system death-on-curing family toxin [Candidatus Saccharibacteria bacterium]
MKIRYFSAEDLLRVHYQVITEFGGRHGVGSVAGLQQVVNTPLQTVDGERLYPTLHEQAAAYLKTIMAEHVFVDAGQATATCVCAMFLARYGRPLTARPIELESFVAHVATGRPSTIEIAAWLRNH